MGTDIHPYAEVRKNGKWERALIRVPDDRNYWAFAVLADVRNGSGFAGCDLGDPVKPISEPRGLPEDRATFDNEVEDYESLEYVWLGDHSHSWVTLAELLALDLDKPITMRGMVHPGPQHEAFLREGKPTQGYCGWSSSKDAISITWQEPIREAAHIIPDIIEALRPLGAPEDVRIVFGFDS